MKITEQQAREWGVVSPSPVKPKDYRSNTERRYAEHLESRRLLGEIESWEHETIRLRLAGGAWFMPDFTVVRCIPNSQSELRVIELHEVKGFWREAAKVRWKVAIDRHRGYRFFLVQWVAKEWRIEEWKP